MDAEAWGAMCVMTKGGFLKTIQEEGAAEGKNATNPFHQTMLPSTIPINVRLWTRNFPPPEAAASAGGFFFSLYTTAFWAVLFLI
jgi:hypothetical protein